MASALTLCAALYLLRPLFFLIPFDVFYVGLVRNPTFTFFLKTCLLRLSSEWRLCALRTKSGVTERAPGLGRWASRLELLRALSPLP